MYPFITSKNFIIKFTSEKGLKGGTKSLLRICKGRACLIKKSQKVYSNYHPDTKGYEA